jgi:tRNA1Val (adenine37-N6)-methyltransferase
VTAARTTEATTADAIFHGRVALVQPARGRGYRVNVDALLLAGFAARALAGGAARGRPARCAVDLGAGVGAVALALLHLGAAERVTLIEVDEELAQLAEANVRANGWGARTRILRTDVKDVHLGEETGAEPADLVVCNPPYVAPGRGRPPAEALARARIGALDAFASAARRLAGRRARVSFVYPAIETTTLVTTLRTRGLEPKRIRPVHGTPGAPARVVLIECAAGRAGGLTLEPALIETDGRGAPSSVVSSLLGC